MLKKYQQKWIEFQSKIIHVMVLNRTLRSRLASITVDMFSGTNRDIWAYFLDSYKQKKEFGINIIVELFNYKINTGFDLICVEDLEALITLFEIHYKTFKSKELAFDYLNDDEGDSVAFIDNITKINTANTQSIDVIGDLVEERLKEVTEIKNGSRSVELQFSGFRDLDFAIKGFEMGDFIVIAARPGMGKTAFILSFIRNMSIFRDNACVMFSLEMTKKAITTRLISNIAEIEYFKFKDPRELSTYEINRMQEVSNMVNNKNFFIIDNAGIDISVIATQVRQLKELYNIKYFVIDYLQLIRVAGYKDRYAMVTHVSQELKKIAKDNHVVCIALAQLSRAVENRADKEPQMQDLRDSGQIEQDADGIFFLYRPTEYGIAEYDNQIVSETDAFLINAKYRNGSKSDKIKLNFDGRYIRFNNYENF